MIDEQELIARLTDIVDIETTDYEEWTHDAQEAIEQLKDDVDAGRLDVKQDTTPSEWPSVPTGFGEE